MTQERKQFQRTEDGHLILMSNEERNLLITDLTARINYGVICLIERVDDFGPIHRNEKLTGFCFDDIGGFRFEVGGGLDIVFAEKIIPYLRPLSSMTEEEKKELQKITDNIFYAHNNYISNSKPYTDGEWHIPNNKFVTNIVCDKLISWLDEKHFDHRTDEEGKTLIEKGLAIEAPEDLYSNKSECDENG